MSSAAQIIRLVAGAGHYSPPRAAISLVGAIIESLQHGAALALFALTLATCIYTLVTVPLFTPRDSTHAIPRALAAVLIIIGLAVI